MDILFQALTNAVTVIQLIAGLCYDRGVMGASFDTGDPRPVYGLKVEVLDSRGSVISGAWVQESYVPPMTETAPVVIPPGASSVRCEVFGPDLKGKWSNAYFAVSIEPPKLHIHRDGKTAILEWDDPGGCWRLEASDNGIQWHDSSATVLLENTSALFRLTR